MSSSGVGDSMMLDKAAPHGRAIAALAVAGLIAGLSACGTTTATTEVVIDPTAQTNSPGGAATATVDGPDETPADNQVATGDSARDTNGEPSRTERVADKNCCKGKNDCKGLGGCKTDANECMGKNDCKGRGGCKTGQCMDEETVARVKVRGRSAKPTPTVVTSPPGGSQMCCRGQNDCKGKGNCKTNDHNCMGLNDCKGKGGCKGPC